jgi:hypothetical protein
MRALRHVVATSLLVMCMTAPSPAQDIVILTGGTSGVYYPLGLALQKIFERDLPNAKVSVISTQATAAGCSHHFRGIGRGGRQSGRIANADRVRADPARLDRQDAEHVFCRSHSRQFVSDADFGGSDRSVEQFLCNDIRRFRRDGLPDHQSDFQQCEGVAGGAPGRQSYQQRKGARGTAH